MAFCYAVLLANSGCKSHNSKKLIVLQPLDNFPAKETQLIAQLFTMFWLTDVVKMPANLYI